ncbi:hypothetical protein [Desulfonatronospira sp.]|uniref:hypothetical protein n=1 Tax=Desulfonatronospira sp. TaxID=1962951 RepID=UPI0025BA3580|nr:hypothetical protein [Desulfonatronospira sp.]
MTRVPIPDRVAELERQVAALTRRFLPTRTRDAHVGNVRETWAARTVEPPEGSGEEYPEYEDGTNHLLPFVFIDSDVESDLSAVEWTDRSEEPKTHAASRIWLPPETPIEVAFANGRYRVVWPCHRLLMVRATQCIKPGQGGTVYAQKWEDGAWVDDELYGELPLCDPDYWVLALQDERFRVTRDCEFEGCFRPAGPYLPPRRVKVTSTIGCNAAGNVSVLHNDSAGCTWSEPDPVCTVSACNKSNRNIGCDKDEEVTLHWTPGEQSGWLVPGDRARLATAVLASDLCAAATASIAGFTALDVCDWNPRTTITEAGNPALLYGCAGQLVLLGWDDDNCEWVVLQVAPKLIPYESNPIVGFRCAEGSEPTLQIARLKGMIAVQWCMDCGEIEWQDLEGALTPVDSVSGVGFCGKTPDTGPREGVTIVDAHCGDQQWPTPTLTLDITPPEGAHQLYLSLVKCAGGADDEVIEELNLGGERYIWIEGVNPPGETTIDFYEFSECECVVLTLQWFDDQSPEQPVGEPFTLGAPGVGICCDDFNGEGNGNGPDPPKDCVLSISTKRKWVLGCGTEQSGASIPLPMLTLDVPDKDASPSYEEVLDEEEVIGCERTTPTVRHCLLGCAVGPGEPITENLTRIEPVTDGTLGASESTGLCWTPLRTPIYVLAGCPGDEAEGDPACLDSIVCPPINGGEEV